MKLGARQLRTVSDRRYDDAAALLKTGKNARANGAIYIAGFAVECLLKAELIESFPWLASEPAGRSRGADRERLWALCYRSHELDEIAEHLPRVKTRLEAAQQRGDHGPRRAFQRVCGEWTIYARYSPQQATLEDAASFLGEVDEIRSCLK